MNVYQLTLLVLLYTVVTFLISCVSATDTTATDTGPVAVEDITVVPESGDSPYAAARVTIQSNIIAISGISNLADDAPRETLTVRIADKTAPSKYRADPASITIPAETLNPAGTSATNIMVTPPSFFIPAGEVPVPVPVPIPIPIPIPVGEEKAPWSYGIELRLEAGG